MTAATRPDVEQLEYRAKQGVRMEIPQAADMLALCAYALHLESRVERLEKALQLAKEHTAELREAWQRGCISEHDGLGGTRSNRNWDIDVKLGQALES